MLIYFQVHGESLLPSTYVLSTLNLERPGAFDLFYYLSLFESQYCFTQNILQLGEFSIT